MHRACGRFLAENGADMLAVDQRNGGMTPKMIMKAMFRYDPTVPLIAATYLPRSSNRTGVLSVERASCCNLVHRVAT